MRSARCRGSGVETKSANAVRNPPTSVSGNFIRSSGICPGRRSRPVLRQLAEQACGRDSDPYSERGHVRTQQNFIEKSAHDSRDHPWTRDSARVTAHALDALGRTEEALYVPHWLRNPKPQPVGFLQRSAFVFLRPQSRLLSARLSRMITGLGVLMTLRAL